MNNKIKVILPVSAILFLITFTGIAAATTNFSITPQNPVKGDKVTMHGNAQPEEEVKVEIFFKKNITVQNGEYLFSLDNVEIPEGKNKFTVVARGCDNLKVSVKMFLIWLTISSEAINNTAKVSRSAPAGIYDILIHGDSREDSVTLEITATAYINADENGEFDFTYDTSPIPTGEFMISAGNITKTIVLREPNSVPPIEPHEKDGSVSPASTPIKTPVSTLTQNDSAQNLTQNNLIQNGAVNDPQTQNQTPVNQKNLIPVKTLDTHNPNQNVQIATKESKIENNSSEYRDAVPGFGFVETLMVIFLMLLVIRSRIF